MRNVLQFIMDASGYSFALKAEYIAFYGHKQYANNMVDYLVKNTSSILVDW